MHVQIAFKICFLFFSFAAAICSAGAVFRAKGVSVNNGAHYDSGSVWPLPQSYKTSSAFRFVDELNFRFVSNEFTCNIVDHAFTRYFKIIFGGPSRPLKFKRLNNKNNELDALQVILQSPCEKYPSLESDESYSLQIDASSAALKAKSVWGILRGLETFSQLVHKIDGKLAVNYTWIEDSPRFPWRGVLLDTSRHFLPVPTILRTLDAMAYNKLNVFHWHIVDWNSFPYESYTFPNLSLEGAYRPYTHVYSQEDVANIIEYARMRGIRVVSEFDTPAHMDSWEYGQPGLLTECYQGGKPSGEIGPIDPSKNSTYEFLEKFFAEVSQVFPDEYLHLGGDEVEPGCWARNPQILEFMKKMGFPGNFMKLENYYLQKLMDLVEKQKKQHLYWQEAFEIGAQMRPESVIHVWKGGYEDMMGKITKAGLRVLLSSPWYLNYIDYGKVWTQYYHQDPQNFNGTDKQKDLVLGGEACMWGEWVDATNLHSRMWPSASAVAERLWSAKDVKSEAAASPRMDEHRCRMVKRGIAAEPPNSSGFCDVEMIL